MKRLMNISPLLWILLLFAASPLLAWSVGISVATEIVIFSLYAVAFNLLLGYTGVLSFGHSLFFGLGAYTVGLIQIHYFQSSIVALFIAIVIGAISGLLVGLVIIKRNGIYFALLTLAFTQMVFSVVHRWTSFTGGETGLQPIGRHFGQLIDPSSEISFFYICAAISFLGICFIWQITRTPFGKTLQGIRDNERRMKLIGCNTHLYKMIALILSAGISALAGGMQTLLVHAAFPEAFNWQSAGIVVMMVVLGGSKHFIGPVLGSIIYIFLQYFVSSLTQHWMIILGGIFVFTIMFLPDGVSSLWKTSSQKKEASLKNFHWKRSEGVVSHESANPAVVGGSLVVSNLSKRFGGVLVADSVSFEVSGGRVLSLLGPNGAGKTTIFNIISGLLDADGGNILLNGVAISGKPIVTRARCGLGRSLQVSSIFNELSVFENVRLSVQQRIMGDSFGLRSAEQRTDVTREAWEILDSLELSSLAAHVANELSHGDRRLVEIAITLGTKPSVILLDEPLAGLSETERKRVIELIRSLTPMCTVLLVEHDVDRVMEISDEIAVLDHGSLIAYGTPSEIRGNKEVQAVYLGDEKQRSTRRSVRTAMGGEHKIAPTILELADVSSGYDKSAILNGVSLRVGKGEVVGLLGRNGVGKSTTALTITGVVRVNHGSISYQGLDVTNLEPAASRRLGISIVPQGRRIFPNLTVLENLNVARDPRSKGVWSVEKVFELVPRLGERQSQLGRYLSGGEQQLLALCRGLMRQTDLLILDEPTEGLSPTMTQLVVDTIKRLISETELSLLLIEQRIDIALELTDRLYLMNNGIIIRDGPTAEFSDNLDHLYAQLGVGD